VRRKAGLDMAQRIVANIARNARITRQRRIGNSIAQ
jgi:hypothetical protein